MKRRTGLHSMKANYAATVEWMGGLRTNAAARVRLLCFPFAGRGATLFRTWSGRLPAEVEVCPVNLPGREKRLNDPLVCDARTLVDELYPCVEEHTDLPLVLFGHSMGAVLAFELARRLSESEPAPVMLIVSGRHAPHVPSAMPVIHDLPDGQFVEAIRGYEGTPEEILDNEELMEIVLPILRADFAVAETYSHREGESLSCALYAYGGQDDEKVPARSVNAWGALTSGRFRVEMFDGGHLFLQDAPATFLEVLSDDLCDAIARLT